MMVGKRSGRPGQAMRRTTSLTEFAPPDVLADVAEEEEEDEELQLAAHAEEEDASAAESNKKEGPYGWSVGGAAGRADWLAAYRARAAPALLGLRRNSADFSAAETAAFLRACGLCNRRLGPGRDTFMYRGDTAFCSLECRQQHIAIEEWKEQCTALATMDTPRQAASMAEPVVKPDGERPDKPAAGAGGGGGMLAAA
ncbi:hypothetical protein EJB05_49320 [Eragrostis curvula]|uniref:FLZ-type domain-containing protein n=1 Tax=Eragrostis curvula TaxID=38414 RepID=A0A5J9T410_9POAL|nr:hypothetical protein EJB05_49320 [Eragrostis curvula]